MDVYDTADAGDLLEWAGCGQGGGVAGDGRGVVGHVVAAGAQSDLAVAVVWPVGTPGEARCAWGSGLEASYAWDRESVPVGVPRAAGAGEREPTVQGRRAGAHRGPFCERYAVEEREYGQDSDVEHRARRYHEGRRPREERRREERRREGRPCPVVLGEYRRDLRAVLPPVQRRQVVWIVGAVPPEPVRQLLQAAGRRALGVGGHRQCAAFCRVGRRERGGAER